ncbi:MAG: hypothetical protein J7604_17705 [Sporocytophaga sp.]|uniref:hypothetical protein n=1 Tax=Sporocytophaga sp. TaxID=2231183 RepID=UPI001B09E760|nr:hypothetical protein [Sporocytophaga sp.]MBO9702048.1 hypothetical protein [Sporocytophaga sp.]
MGLDSVLLLIEIEQYFGIEILNSDAEKINTVQDMVNMVARYLSIEANDFPLKDDMLQMINQALKLEGLINDDIYYSDFIFKTIDPLNEESWDSIAQKTGLVLPKPYVSDQSPSKWLSFLKWIPKYKWEKITAGHFIDAVCACNHQKLVDPKNITDIYEILVSVIAITVDCIGVDYYEIEMEKSFTNDLGID